jgi:hypothetical protein
MNRLDVRRLGSANLRERTQARSEWRMADRVQLSLWMNNFSPSDMLPAWAKCLAEFPVSSLSPGIRDLAVYPFRWGETPVLKQCFEEGVRVTQAVALAAEFLHEDYAYEVNLNWDVWVSREPGTFDQWEKLPSPVSVACLGPQFEVEDTGDHPNFLLDLGPDSLFLPESADQKALEEALQGIAENCYRENVSQLLGYVQRLEGSLSVTRRILWLSSGEDLAERIRVTYGH